MVPCPKASNLITMRVNLPTNFSDYLPLPQIIKQAKEGGFSFGAGDPYNRLRYYIRIGLLPNMVRRSIAGGSTQGHLPASAVDLLLKIQGLREKGLDYEQIKEQVLGQKPAS